MGDLNVLGGQILEPESFHWGKGTVRTISLGKGVIVFNFSRPILSIHKVIEFRAQIILVLIFRDLCPFG